MDWFSHRCACGYQLLLFNCQIWRRSPKALSTSLTTVDLSVTIAIIEFDRKGDATSEVLKQLGIKKSSQVSAYIKRKQSKLLSDAARHASPPQVAARKLRELIKKGLVDKAHEGVLYGAGMFN